VVEIATDADFQNIIHTSDERGDTSYRVPANALDPEEHGTEFYVRVVAADLCGQTTVTEPVAFTTLAATDGDADTDVDSDIDSDIDTDVDTDVDTDIDVDGDGDVDGDTDVDGDGDADADVPVDADPDRPVDAEPDVEDGGPVCVAQAPIAVDFSAGTGSNIDLEAVPAVLQLDEDWEVRWDAASGALPSVSDPTWTLDAPAGGITEMGVDPVTGEPAVHIDATGVVGVLRYVRDDLGLSNARGSAFEIRARVVQAWRPEGFDCAVEMRDGARWIRLGMDELRIVETNTEQDFVMDTTDASHTYSLGMRLAGFSVTSDGVFVFDEGAGDSSSDTGIPWLRWGDESASTTIACEMYVNHFYYDTRGDVVPYFSSGTWSSYSFDLGAEPLCHASIVGDLPMEHVLVETRTSADGADWPATWDALAADGTVQSALQRYLQMQVVLTGDTTDTPEVRTLAIGSRVLR
jgi:hypothetical protein